jgi:serine/threonine-protein kinase
MTDLGRYVDLGLIGTGAMGEVRRVRDPSLGRVMAMKIMRPEVALTQAALERFTEEAQATAQLQHPGIVPVHELGRLPDGRVYFTMNEVRGTTLRDAHLPLRRAVHVLHRVSEAVAYAHACGVVHRDLKPDNVMLGDFGEVLVLDWGLAKVRAGDVVTVRSDGGAFQTGLGQVAGTPAYMAPEQAYGAIDRISPRSDVYALGAMLYEMLAGRPPYAGTDGWEVLEAVRAGPPPPLRTAGSAAVPAELATVCARAMARAPEDRHAHAGALATDLGAWLEGTRRREQARAIVRVAQAAFPQVDGLRTQARVLRAEAAAMLRAVRPWEPAARKHAGWEREDAAAALERQATVQEIESVQLLHAALTHASDLPEAHALLAEHYRARHADAERRRDAEAATTCELLLRAHDDGLHAAYLRGDGALTLVTDPPGAEVELHRYAFDHRRLVPVPIGPLGRTPLRAVELPMGSYLLVLRAPGHADVRYPVHIARQEHHDGVRPGDAASCVIPLPREGELGPDDCYVPAGWYQAGGLSRSRSPVIESVWVDAFVMRRTPVTNAECLAHLDRLAPEEAERHAPRERGAGPGQRGARIYGRDAAGRYVLQPDADGDLWLPDWPVVMVDWTTADALARSMGWRLPWEDEWEKAARGVDARAFPWGEHLDPSWGCIKDSHAGPMLPARVTEYPLDESPYGVRGLSGNVSEWCLDAMAPTGDERAHVIRGGSFRTAATGARAAERHFGSVGHRDGSLGFRLVRSFRG